MRFCRAETRSSSQALILDSFPAYGFKEVLPRLQVLVPFANRILVVTDLRIETVNDFNKKKNVIIFKEGGI